VSTLKDIHNRVNNGQRLSEDDALFLYEKADLIELGQLANHYNQTKNGRNVYYNVNRHINPTNICVKSCKFCAFSRKPGDEGAYEYTLDEVLAKAKDVAAQGATEVHMVGGLHPRWNFQTYLTMLGAIKEQFPQLHIKAFTAVEIDWLAAKARLTIFDTLTQLKNAGLGSMPGGGAEIFHPEVREQICDTKTDAARWIDIHRTAHNAGLKTNCTMLYGHIENYSHRVDHMKRLRDLQDETHGFNVFIPLAFQPHDNDMGINRYTLGVDDLKNIAVARLFLDNFTHIKSYWVMLGPDIAQMALHFGANDLDGTVTEEKISRMAGGRSGMVLAKSQIHNMIRKANRIPVERDTLYNQIWKNDVDVKKSAERDTHRDEVNMLLYKVEHNEKITPEKEALLAQYASIFDLGQAANMVKKRVNKSQFGTLLPSYPLLNEGPLEKLLASVDDVFTNPNSTDDIDPNKICFTLDLADPSVECFDHSLNTICSFISQAKSKRPNLSISLQGVRSIWKLGRKQNLTLEETLEQLSSSGLTNIESSQHENEEHLTTFELIDFHRKCHQFDMNTVAKIELCSTYSGGSLPFWDQFVTKANAYKELQNETKGILGLSLEVGAGSFITPVEFIRAISVLRIITDNIEHVFVPFGKIPTLKAHTHTGDINSDPALKLAAMVIYFGASDLGEIPITDSNPQRLIDELVLSGIPAKLGRDSLGL